MNENDKYCIQTIFGAIDKIQKFSENFKTAEEFCKHDLNYDAVALNLVVVSEMVSKLSDEFKLKFNYITWEMVKIVEDKVTNTFIGTNVDYLWKVIRNHIPHFKYELEKLPLE